MRLASTQHGKLLIAGALASWAVALLVFVAALRDPAPLRLDVGAGDDALAGGFREGWSSYEVRGKNTFRWTGEIAQLAVPARLSAGSLTLTSRVARFSDGRVPLTLAAGGRLVAQWTQGPMGWRLRDDLVGPVRGEGLTITFLSTTDASGKAGLALDWVEIKGARWALPRARGWLGLALLCLAVPGLIALAARTPWPLLVVGPATLVALGLVAYRDPVAALTVGELAGPRCLAATTLVVGVWLGLRRVWRAAREGHRGAIVIPATASVLALCFLSCPRYYYPDVDTHARFLAGIREKPGWALDPREYQLARRAWTRRIGGRLVGFPYSAAFHVAAWPLAPALGEVGATKTVAAAAVGLSVLGLYFLTLAARASPATGIVAQGVFVLLPAVTSRLTLALWPSLLGQGLELALLVALARGAAAATGAAAFLRLTVLLLLVQAGYTGSLLNVGVVVTLLVMLLLARGPRLEAMRLTVAYALSATLIVAVLYHHFLAVLWQQVLPHAGEAATASATGGVFWVLERTFARLLVFYGPVCPVLAVLGARRLASAPAAARRVLLVAIVGALGLAFLRAGVPAMFSDAKEVELLAGPIALLMAIALSEAWGRALPWRIAGLAAATGFVAWALWYGGHAYVDRLVVAAR